MTKIYERELMDNVTLLYCNVKDELTIAERELVIKQTMKTLCNMAPIDLTYLIAYAQSIYSPVGVLREEEILLGQSRLNYFLMSMNEACKMLEKPQERPADLEPFIPSMDSSGDTDINKFPCFDFQLRGAIEYATKFGASDRVTMALLSRLREAKNRNEVRDSIMFSIQSLSILIPYQLKEVLNDGTPDEDEETAPINIELCLKDDLPNRS